MLEGVAVDTLSVALVAVYHVAIDDALVIVRQVALADGQVFVGHVGGRDEAVGQVGVDAVCRDVYAEGLHALPCAVGLPQEHFGCDVGSSGSHSSPRFEAGTDVWSAEGVCGPVGRKACDVSVCFVFDMEAQRRHVLRHGHPDVVGIEARHGVRLGEVLRHLAAPAGGCHEDERKEKIYETFHRYAVFSPLTRK